MFKDDLFYIKEHQWLKVETNLGIVGITDFAQSQLGDITWVELPAEGDVLSKGDRFGSVESIKSINDVFCPVDLKVLEINENLMDNPNLVNDDPYGAGWFIKVEIINAEQVATLLNAGQYQKYIESLE